MLPTVMDVVMQRFDTTTLTSQLRANPSNKLDLWNQLKVTSFAQCISLVYSGCLLSVLLKVEINILGGNMFKELSQTDEGKGGELQGHSSIEKQYLSSVQYFIESGIPQVCDLVERSAELVLRDTALKDQHTVHTVTDLLLQIHASVMKQIRSPSGSQSEDGTFAAFMFSPELFRMAGDDGLLTALTNATQDVFECPDLPYVLEIVVQKGLSSVRDVFQDVFHSSVQGTPSTSLPLAKVIPLISDSSSSLSSGVYQGRLVQDVLTCKELHQFSHNIYEAFSTDS
jgi:peroxin-3